MNAGIEMVVAPFEAMGISAWAIVTLNQQHGFSGFGKHSRNAQATYAGTDDDDIVSFFFRLCVNTAHYVFFI
jgi:hypothetical protein